MTETMKERIERNKRQKKKESKRNVYTDSQVDTIHTLESDRIKADFLVQATSYICGFQSV